MPRQAQLVVEVGLLAQDVGFVKLGQRTEIKVTAYPFEQYGSIPGKIVWISPTSESTSNLISPPEGESHQAPVPPPQSSPQSVADQDKDGSPPTLYYRIKVSPSNIWLQL